MDSFLGRIAETLHREYPVQPGKIALVFPNRRAGLYFKKHLANLLEQAVWLPDTFSIEDFIYKVLDRQKAEHEFLLFEFYHIHTQIKKEKAQPFQDFADWAETALKDFNDIDLSLVNASGLYQNIDEAKAIQLWNPGQPFLTPFESNYLDFFRSFGEYYKLLSESQLAQQKLSQGLAYRTAAENTDSIIRELAWEKVWFVGFNALNSAEKIVIQALTMAGKARVFYDIDKYYFDDETQEAGNFLREHLATTPPEKLQWLSDRLLTEPKEIEIIGVPQLITQAKVAGQILAGIHPETHEKTAVVMGDESLLIPMIHSLPDNLGEFNVTMGMPLRLSPLHALFESLFQLYRTAIIFSAKQKENEVFNPEKLRFYHSDLVNFLVHPGIISFSPASGAAARKIQVSNRSFYSANDIRELLFQDLGSKINQLGHIFELDPYQPFNLVKGSLYLIELMKDALTETDDLNKEYLYHFTILFKNLLDLSLKYNPVIDLIGLKALYRQVVSVTKLPFYGEPLKGVQFMGMLETRNLDFEQLIILNVNEDIMPSGKTHNSFIPFDIRKEYGLPTYRDNQSVYAYHFYHLLQHAKTVYILYNTEPGKVGGGDKSRFIGQLIHEMPKKNPAVVIRERVLHLFPSTESQSREIIIEKTPDILQKLNTIITETGLSASRLNIYLSCQLRFYFESVEKLRESEEVEETMEAGTFGNAIHKALYELYLPWIKRPLGKESFKDIKSKIETTAIQCFKDILPEGDLSHGKNHLLVQTGISLIKKLVSLEEKRMEKDEQSEARIILSLEQKYKIERNGITYVGIIDRIDKSGNRIEILDYKTGNVEAAGLKFSNFEELASKKGADKLFQLLFYLLLTQKEDELEGFKIEPGIVPLRKLNKGVIYADLPAKDTDLSSFISEFQQYLELIVAEIRDISKPFTQTIVLEKCKYCPFTAICNRA